MKNVADLSVEILCGPEGDYTWIGWVDGVRAVMQRLPTKREAVGYATGWLLSEGSKD